MGVEIFDAQAAPITVTKTAGNHLRKQLNLSGKPALRLSLKESGCTGFMYVLDEVEQGEPGDLELGQEGFVIYLDVASLPMLRGTELDFVFEGLNRVLKFNNPNVKAACGCGESFSVEDGVTYS